MNVEGGSQVDIKTGLSFSTVEMVDGEELKSLDWLMICTNSELYVD